MKKLCFIISFWVAASSAFAEGTKELRPTENSRASLHIGRLGNNYTPFGEYGSPPQNQMHVSIANLNETIYFGFGGVGGGFGGGGSRPFRIVSPSGQIVYQGNTPTNGAEGFIADWDAAVAGPQELGNGNGYNAIALQPTEVGDYIIEFDASGGDFTISLFDVTVAGTDNQPILGRLHSLGWQIDTGSYNNPFEGVVYPYDPNGIVYEVDFNGMQPFLFVINFNSKGTSNTGDFVADRQSKIGEYTYPEFDVFLNPPDPVLYPTFERTVTFNGEVTKSDCMGTEYCLNFSSNVEGYLDGFIDVDADDQYDSNVDVYFNHQFTGNGTHCIPWDGRDANGNPVTSDDLKVIASFGFGVTHLPIFDAEHNRNGYIVSIASPAGLPAPKVYWDDSRIIYGDMLGDPQVNLIGCDPAITGGCHKWRNRGDINGNPPNDPDSPSAPETINTWWYAKVLYDTLLISMVGNPPVQLSFDPAGLRQNDTTVCEGSPVPFYIYNDGLNHYDLAKYNYDWFINNTGPVAQNVRNTDDIIYQTSEIVIRATDVSNSACVSYDTLRVLTVPPVTIQADIVNSGCDQGLGSVAVTILTSPPNPEYTWTEFPGNTSNRIDANPGTYSLHIEDPDFPLSCALDTSFTIEGTPAIGIEDLTADSSLCYRNTGAAEVFMVDPSRPYSYSWDGAPGPTQPTISGLSPGNHTILVTDMETGCTDDSTFVIYQTPITISVITEDVVCSEPTGSIEVTLPDDPSYFTVSWNGSPENVLTKSNLGMGDHFIEVVAISNATCRDDTNVTIGGTTAIAIEEITTEPSLCYEYTGEAEVFMEDPARTYVYSWDGQATVPVSTASALAPGSHTIHVTEPSTGCEDDSTFIIEDVPFPISVVKQDIACTRPAGRIQVNIPSGNFDIFWDGQPDNVLFKGNLTEGTYEIEVVATINPDCRADTTVSISSYPGIAIRELITAPSLCYRNTGEATVLMEDPAREYVYSWDNRAYVPDSSVTGLGPGTHVVLVREPSTGCTDDTTFTIDPLPFTISATTQDVVCSQATGVINLTIPADGNFNIYWNNQRDNVTTRTNLTSGSYDIRVVAAANASCSADTSVIIGDSTYTVPADFTFVSLAYQGVFETESPIQFTNTTPGNIVSSDWNFGDGGTSQERDPEYTYYSEGDYTITLAVRDENGCPGVVQKKLAIALKVPCGIEFPNAFTPNDDNANDNIGILGYAPVVELKIFNRWGEVIFRTFEIPKRWDGTYRGTESPVGVYPFILEWECPNERGKLVKYRRVGDVSLIR